MEKKNYYPTVCPLTRKHWRLWLLIVLAALMSTRAFAQSRTITGTVLGQDGAAIIGATINVQGTSLTTITDVDGKFTLSNVPTGAMLNVTYVGFKPQTIAVHGRDHFSIRMDEDVSTLNEVVSIGYGTQKKATLTGSVSNLSGADLVKSPAANVGASLEGKMTGLIVNQRTGEPGRDDPNIVIRGFGTLGNSSPLIIIDGVERGNMTRLNPEDIENITVLKDASAAIYGARAANGVILVTTKQGKAGKPQFSFNANVGFSRPTKIPDMLDAVTYAQVMNEGDWYRKGRPDLSSYTAKYSDATIQKIREGSDPILYPNTNWVDECLRPYSLITRTSFQATGGTDNVRYLLSFGSMSQGAGFYHYPEKYEQYTFRGNLSVDLSKNLTINANISALINNQRHTTIQTWINFANILESSPLLPAKYPGGLIAGGRLGESPLLLDQRGFDRVKSSPVYASFSATYKVPWVKGLQIEASFNYDFNNQFEKFFEVPYYYYDYNTESQTFDKKKGTGQSMVDLRDTYGRWTTMMYNFRIHYDRTFGVHHVGAMLGQEQQKNTYNTANGYRKNFISSAIPELNVGSSASADKDNGGTSSSNARNNYFGRFNYDYMSKYLVELLFRVDGSENFPSNKRYGFFPAASLGWRVSEEPWIKNNYDWIDQIKLRLSVGQTGNDRVAAFQYLQTYGFGGNYVFGTTDVSGITPNTMPNLDITWERSTKLDVGVDGSFWNGLLGFELTYFHESRNHILAARDLSIPNTKGFPALPDENIGKVKNNGFEIHLTHHNRIGELIYNLDGNFSYAKNSVVFMDETPHKEAYQDQTGKPLGTQLYYKADGIFNTQEELDSYPHAAGTQVGDIKIVDLNNDKVIDSDDQYRFPYTSTPRITFGLNSNFEWKGFDLNLFFQGQAGAYNYDSEFTSLGKSDDANSNKQRADNRWTVDNPNGTMPRADAFQPGNTTFFLYNSSFIRLKNAELGYTFPRKWTSILSINQLRLYVSGSNLLTWAKDIKWCDPEINGNFLYYPQQRVINIGVNIKF
jgi:TonB-linked SusC/RagA family outer membrane protein